MNTDDAIRNLETHMATFGTTHGPVAAHSLYQYLLLSRRFLDGAGGNPEGYIAQFVAGFHSQNSRRFAYYVIRRLFEANGWPWLTGNRAPWKGQVIAPMLSVEDIELLISVRDSLQPRDVGYLALSTTYGLRRGEMASMRQENFANGRMSVQTLKHGMFRDHMLPREISPYVRAVQRLDPSQVSISFQRMCRAAYLETEPRAGFHSIRRALITELLKDCSPVAVSVFLGWKRPKFFATAAEEEMLSPLVASVMGTYARMTTRDVDEEIFGKHPFLHLWR